MNQDRIDALMLFAEKKLSERKVKEGDHEHAIKALSGCVLAGLLITAYKITNNLQ